MGKGKIDIMEGLDDKEKYLSVEINKGGPYTVISCVLNTPQEKLDEIADQLYRWQRSKMNKRIAEEAKQKEDTI